LLAAALGLAGTALLSQEIVAEQRRYELDREQPLVVIAADGVLLRKGNGLSYPPRYETPLNRGVEARVLCARGAWRQIELAGGEVGWVQYDQILPEWPFLYERP